MAGCEAVFHAAADTSLWRPQAAAQTATNVHGTQNLLRAAEAARAQVRAWQARRFGQAYVLGGEEASFVDFVHRVGTALGKRTPRGAMPRWALMTYARALEAWSRIGGQEPRVTPEGAALTSHHARVDSAKARRELGYVETPLDALLADTLQWMKHEGMLGS
jgi:nucleoside-diphosphate-sugar epimerase